MIKSIAILFKSFIPAFKFWKDRKLHAEYFKDQYALILSGKDYDPVVEEMLDEEDDILELIDECSNASFITCWRAAYLNMIDDISIKTEITDDKTD